MHAVLLNYSNFLGDGGDELASSDLAEFVSTSGAFDICSL
jgi:hypothetical protein